MISIVVGTNSYISLSDADSYLNQLLGQDQWLCRSDLDKTKALITSSEQISLFVKSSCALGQILIINESLQRATSKLAAEILTDPKIISQSNTSENIKRAKAGSAEVEFFRPTSGARFPSTVMTLLQASGCIDGNSISAPFVSGTGAPSSFCDTNQFGVSEGFK